MNKEESPGKIAIILVRGLIGVKTEIKDTLRMLNLKTKNHCSIIDSSASSMGMIKKAKDYITWGVIDEETLKLLKGKEGQKSYALGPPRKGYGRKGIKHPFSKGGALGDRREKINDLIKRMV